MQDRANAMRGLIPNRKMNWVAFETPARRQAGIPRQARNDNFVIFEFHENLGIIKIIKMRGVLWT